MARPREPVDLIAAKGRKHLTIAEYVERKNAGKTTRFFIKKREGKVRRISKTVS